MSAGRSTATVANAATDQRQQRHASCGGPTAQTWGPLPTAAAQARADNASTDRAGALKVTSTMVCALLAALLAIVAARVRLRRVGAGTAPARDAGVVSTRGGAYEANTPGRQNAALPPELAAHPDDSAAYEDWRAWRQRRRTWFTEHGLSYDFSEDLRLRRFVRQSGGSVVRARRNAGSGRPTP